MTDDRDWMSQISNKEWKNQTWKNQEWKNKEWKNEGWWQKQNRGKVQLINKNNNYDSTETRNCDYNNSDNSSNNCGNNHSGNQDHSRHNSNNHSRNQDHSHSGNRDYSHSGNQDHSHSRNQDHRGHNNFSRSNFNSSNNSNNSSDNNMHGYGTNSHCKAESNNDNNKKWSQNTNFRDREAIPVQIVLKNGKSAENALTVATNVTRLAVSCLNKPEMNGIYSQVSINTYVKSIDSKSISYNEAMKQMRTRETQLKHFETEYKSNIAPWKLVTNNDCCICLCDKYSNTQNEWRFCRYSHELISNNSCNNKNDQYHNRKEMYKLKLARSLAVAQEDYEFLKQLRIFAPLFFLRLFACLFDCSLVCLRLFFFFFFCLSIIFVFYFDPIVKNVFYVLHLIGFCCCCRCYC